MTNELLLRALDRAVLSGKIIPKAVTLLHDLYASKCEVDPKANAVFLNGASLDEAIEKIVREEYQFLIPVTPTQTEADKVEVLKAEALGGSVTAHGALCKAIGEAAYQAWAKANKARPGKDSTPQDDAISKIQAQVDALKGRRPNGAFTARSVQGIATADNPWSAGAWNLTAQGKIVRDKGAEAAAEIAAAVGSHIGATKPARAA